MLGWGTATWQHGLLAKSNPRGGGTVVGEGGGW